MTPTFGVWTWGGPGGMPGSPEELISSTREEGDPAYSPDGKRIAYRSWRTGGPEIWICDSEGRNQVQLTSGFSAIQGLRWSPDGQSIAFSGIVEGSQQVYVVSVGEGVPRRLTTQPGTNQWPFWSHDGRWLYFKNAPVTGQPQVWKVPPQGGQETRVTHSKEGVDTPQESPDGKSIYFGRGWPFTLSIWRVPIEGGEETKVLDPVYPNTRWTVRQHGIYYLAVPDANGARDLCFFDFGGGKVRKLLRAPRKITGEIAISPDGRMVLYGQGDESGSDLMLVENFR